MAKTNTILNQQQLLDIKTHKKKFKVNRLYSKLFEAVFFVSAVISILALLLIGLFIIIKGSPAMAQIGIFEFLLGRVWQPGADVFGILPMIVGSFYITLGAILIGVPVGVMCGVFMAEMAGRKWEKRLKPFVELLAGIPSVVYGFFGLVVIVPLIYSFGGEGNMGNSMLAAIIILSIMILPIIVSITEESLRAVPESYKEGSLALGATHIHTVFHVLLPAAKSGVFSGIVLGIGRAIGETMAVLLVAGNSPVMPKSIWSSVRTLTTNCALEMGYAFGLHEGALFATGMMLFIFIMMLNVFLIIIRGKAMGKE